MRALTTGLVVVGLLLTCLLAWSREYTGVEHTLTEWGFIPMSQWVLHNSSYVSDDGDGLKGTVCETYIVPPSPFTLYGLIVAYRYPDEVKWCKIAVPVGEVIVVFEDYDHDDLWTRRER